MMQLYSQIILFRFILVLLQNCVFLSREYFFLSLTKNYQAINDMNFYSPFLSFLLGFYLYKKNPYKSLIYFILSGNIIILSFYLMPANYLLQIVFFTLSETWASVTLGVTSWYMITSTFSTLNAKKTYFYFILAGNCGTIVGAIIFYYVSNLLVIIVVLSLLTLYLSKKTYVALNIDKSDEVKKPLSLTTLAILIFLTFYIIFSIKIMDKTLYDNLQILNHKSILLQSQVFLGIVSLILQNISSKKIEVNFMVFFFFNAISRFFYQLEAQIFFVVMLKSLRYSIIEESLEIIYTQFDKISQNKIKIIIFMFTNKVAVFLTSVIIYYFFDIYYYFFLIFNIIYVYNIIVLKRLKII